MRRLSILGLVSTLWLAACGGNTLSGTSTPPPPTSTGPTVTGISVLTSSPQVASDGTGPATITAFVHDANNNTIPGATVAFSASSGLVAVTNATTDATGAASATVSAGSDPTNRMITVTATSSSVSAPVNVAVIGTTLKVVCPTALVAPASGTCTVSLHNSAGGGIPSQQVAATSSTGNMISPATVTTDTNGQGTFTVTAANGGTDTITVTSLGLSATATLSVSTQSFVINPPTASTNVNLGAYQAVTLTWSNGSAPVSGQAVTFATTRGKLYKTQPTVAPSPNDTGSTSVAVTIAGGTVTVYLASTTSGAATVSATATDASTMTPVSTQVGVDFIATTPASINAQASPSTISVSAQSTITAVVRDADNNLVEGKMVTFSLSDVTGGTLSLASALTDSQGIAQTIYTASTTTSATNGVSVAAAVQGVAQAATTTLTVAGRTVFLSLGTGNKVASINNNTQYSLPYSVQAIDGAGNAVPGVTIDLQVVAVNYMEGQMSFTTSWAPNQAAIECGTEDANPAGGNANYNGILDVVNGVSEDYNGDSKLEPGTVAAASPGTVVTTTAASATADAPAGSATFNVVYPQDHAYWVQIALVATASVAGTESAASATFTLPGLAADYSSATVAPPGQYSPYGITGTCKPPLAKPFYLTSY